MRITASVLALLLLRCSSGGSTGDAGACDPATFQSSACYSGPAGTLGKGVCKGGTSTCENGKVACNGEIAPSAEICDLRDNDCNGVVDDVPEIANATVLGHCTSPACAPNAVGAAITCTTSDKGICGAGRKVCAAGGTPTGCERLVTQGAAEVCNGVDDDCNGQVDDALVPVDCTNDAGVGECAKGKSACSDGGVTCATNMPAVETCNGLDEDCNGAVDDHACQQTPSNFYCCVLKQQNGTGTCVGPSSPLLSNANYKCAVAL